jgi:hypothetical protein
MVGENPQKETKRAARKSKKRRETGLKTKKRNTSHSSSHELPGCRGILHKSDILFSLPCASNDNSFRIVLN